MDGTIDPVQIEYRPPREFYAAAGRNALASLGIDEGGAYGDDDHADGEGERKEFRDHDRFKEEEGEWSETDRNEVAFESRGKQSRREGNFSPPPRRHYSNLNPSEVHSDKSRRNAQLRLESFLNGLESSSITVCLFLSSPLQVSLANISQSCLTFVFVFVYICVRHH